MLIEIIPESKSYKSDTFSYIVPQELEKSTEIGSIAYAPFGKRHIRGCVERIIIDHNIADKPKYSLKHISSINLNYKIPKEYIPVIDWIAEHYLCTHGEALSLFLPPEMKRPPKLKDSSGPSAETIIKQLSDAQNDIYSKIIDAGAGRPHLIHGVTGSGKTEIYIHLCQNIIAQDKSAVVLVPEIMLTPQTVDRFKQVFGETVALLHSNLSTGEKCAAYRDFSSGAKKIIIGPRSAILVPNSNIGLIIIDEEHEESYKQDNTPRYHAVDLAEKISEALSATLVLGSATPRIETFYKAQEGRYSLHKLQSRYNKLILPPAETVDLRKELRSKNSSIISIKLQEAISQVLQKQKQAILFLNRRGSSTFVSCRECGFVASCPNCDIPLVHHSATGSYLYCHHCDYKQNVPDRCPTCGGVKIKYFGTGVEKVESEINLLFPEARVRRIDASTITSKHDYEKFYTDFKEHRFDIAIGTQMITKGLDMPHVDLVGIISADTGLHLPNFRADEKIFRLVTQVSGRSGRSSNVGKTIIQTYWPDSRAIQFATTHDFIGFYEQEIEVRKIHQYPPFRTLLRIVSEHEKPAKAKNDLKKLCLGLDNLISKYPEIEYLGPGLCFFQRIRNRWRYHLIVKLPHSSSREIKDDLRELWKANLNLTWDMDPVELL